MEMDNAIIRVRQYRDEDIPAMIEIWNAIVEEGIAFRQREPLNELTEKKFFNSQTACGVAIRLPDTDEEPENFGGTIVGLYILHPNNEGRCGHIANASYAVEQGYRGFHIGEMLVKDCLEQAKSRGFRLMQFNAVVESNTHARHLYERLGFIQLGVIPGGFLMMDGHYENICPYYREL